MSSQGQIPSSWEPMSLHWMVELRCEVHNLPQMFVLMHVGAGRLDKGMLAITHSFAQTVLVAGTLNFQ